MAELNLPRTQELLDEFRFGDLFVEVLGWNQPPNRAKSTHTAKDIAYHRRMVAELSGVAVFECWVDSGLPGRAIRDAIQRDVTKQHHENLVIFLDRPEKPLQSFWCWARREDGKRILREHSYFRGQPTDLFIGKIQGLLVELTELDQEGKLPIVEVTARLKAALDVEQTTKRFFRDYEEQHAEFLRLIEGIRDERDRRWYASILLNRLMFIWFLQKKGFLEKQNRTYLLDKLKASHSRGKDEFFSRFLRRLFFEGFAKPPEDRKDPEGWLGEIPYLNGGLFLPHRLEVNVNGRLREDLHVPDRAFANLFALFGKYTWHLDDTPGGKADEINPSVLGYIFEKYINQKAFGAYYTRPEITDYLCERTLYALILDRVRQPAIPDLKLPAVDYESVPEMLSLMDGPLACKLVIEVLPDLKLLDPAVGSGAFLVAAMKALINVYSAVLGKADVLNNRTLTAWKKKLAGEHKNLAYGLKRQIITDNLYGVDIMQEGCEIARLRLFLALVASARSIDELEPLPNIDFNIQAGNSIVGLTHVEGKEFDNLHGRHGDLFKKSYKDLVAEKERAVENYRHAATYSADLRSLRAGIETLALEATAVLDDVLRAEMHRVGVRFEQATWDAETNQEGRPARRSLTMDDIAALRPFHWGYEFHDILARGGFDAILGNPPWEAVKPNAKEFFENHSELVTKKKMTLKDFGDEQTRLLRDPEIRDAWIEYLSRFPHQSAWFRASAQFPHQTAIVNGKKTGSDLNLYKLFTEQCWNLLRPHGRCGLVVQGGIYSDLGCTGLRDMLFNKSAVDSLFGLSNEKFIFEEVHHAQKFALLVFEKGKQTDVLEVAFRINPREAVKPEELDRFLHGREQHLLLPIALVRRLSPDSRSLLEFRSAEDVAVAEKAYQHPLLGESVSGAWDLRLTSEFHMKNDADLFMDAPAAGALPLFEGKVMWQFESNLSQARHWIDEKQGRRRLLGKEEDRGQLLEYQFPRLSYRRQSASTNERTLIATMSPRTFQGDNLAFSRRYDDEGRQQISDAAQVFLCAVFNSFVFDYLVRYRVTNNLNFFHLYQLPIPRLTEKDGRFGPIVARAARLLCTTIDFDDLAKSAGLTGYRDGASEPNERIRLRAELDGLIAHLYELTEREFTHVLGTFPLVSEEEKRATISAYKEFAPKTDGQQVQELIRRGEGAAVEFKATARWDLRENKPNKLMEAVVIKTVGAFLNSDGGDLLIGVQDDGSVFGLAADYKTLGQKQNRDGFENWLTTQVLDAFGKDIAPSFQISFSEIEGKDLCRVNVSPAPRACFIKEGNAEHLYVRAGNSTRLLNTREAIEYCREHWKQ